jgi:hypothetical protein
MTGSATFGGGQIDVAALLGALAGRPLQARLHERFTPVVGGRVEERTGRIQVSSTRCARFDILQGAGPEVAFVYDLASARVGSGISDQPSTWSWAPWNIRSHPDVAGQPLEPVPPDAIDLEGSPCRLSEYEGGGTISRHWNSLLLGIPIRIESTSDVGERLFRIYDIRYEEPPAEAFVLAPE